jgi:predicted DNA-binding WGR domain protein
MEARRMKTVHSKRAPMAFRQIDPSRRRARMYHLAEAISLFGERGIVISWGGIGRAPRVRFEPFKSKAALEKRWHELVVRRLAHGYQLVHVDMRQLARAA